MSLLYCWLWMFQWVLGLGYSNAQPLSLEITRPGDSLYIKSREGYSRKYPFIRYAQNSLEWDSPLALEKFFTALESSNQKKVKVLHMGDSHVQADFFTGVLRQKMRATFGSGGRGFIFPYASAGTHSTMDYRTSSFGYWRYAKNIQATPDFTLGLSGVTIYTEDVSAGFKIEFREGFLHPEDRILKIYGDRNDHSYDLMVCLPSGDTLSVPMETEDGKPYAQVRLPYAPSSFTIRLSARDENAEYFQCYGLSLENTDTTGMLYASVGINGAGYTSLLRQGLMPEQLRELNPDLVVIDLGANDFYPRVMDQPVFEDNLKNLINIMRAVCPGISILVTCSQDVYCRKKNVAECKRFASVARAIAFEKDCAFYDYYQVSGGQYAMQKWYQQKLAKPDRVHLTVSGYELKAELYFNAYLYAYRQWLSNASNSFILKEPIPNTEFPTASTPELKEPIKTPTPTTTSTATWRIHTVKSGETLSEIAEVYHTTVTQIKSWNGLSSDRLKIGQTLKVKKEVIPAKPAPLKSARPVPVPRTPYIVKSGDNLWEIAKKFQVTVEEIRKLNGPAAEDLHPGDKLILP